MLSFSSCNVFLLPISNDRSAREDEGEGGRRRRSCWDSESEDIRQASANSVDRHSRRAASFIALLFVVAVYGLTPSLRLPTLPPTAFEDVNTKRARGLEVGRFAGACLIRVLMNRC